MIFIKRILFSFFCIFIVFLLYWHIFKPIYLADTVLFPYAIHPFNLCEEQPILWNIIKVTSLIFFLFSHFTIYFSISQKIFFQKVKKDKNEKSPMVSHTLSLFLGYNNLHDMITIPEKSLYQNILITGTIGTGKTSSAMYPFTKQLIEYKRIVPKKN